MRDSRVSLADLVQQGIISVIRAIPTIVGLSEGGVLGKGVNVGGPGVL